jgi:diguanylate cyclase (GGDEF)-like protein
VRDPLTGTFNRRYLNTVLPVVVAAARQTGRPLSALLVDLDHFKHVNDRYGHAVGDLVLSRVASLLVESARAGDAVIRYGGEEFLIIAQETGLDAATILGERMRQRIVAEAIALPGGGAIQTTASIGVASLSMHNDQDDLLVRADEALYAAKAKGRNQVVTA